MYTTETVRTAEQNKSKNHFVTVSITGITPGIYKMQAIGLMTLTDGYDYPEVTGPVHCITLNVGGDNPDYYPEAPNRNRQILTKFIPKSLYIIDFVATLDLTSANNITIKSGLQDKNNPLRTGYGEIEGIYEDKTILVLKANLLLIREQN
jgi:hypothetical protein